MGEKKAFVTLELSEPTEITGIDIGNEHSCFIEVQVGNKGDQDSDFKELLLTSSFQTPAESRNSDNVNRVRCFNKTAFVESNAGKKWELVKLICSQPFNSRVQFGVSFITIYATEESKSVEPPKQEKKGIFSVREASPDSDLDSSSLFSRWKQSKANVAEASFTPSRPTAAAAIRDARNSIGERRSPLLLTPTPASSRKRPSTETPILDRNRNNLLYDDDDEEEGNEALEQLIEKDKKRAEEQLKKESKKPESPKPKDATAPSKKFKFSENKKDDSKSRSQENEKDFDSVQLKPVESQKPKKPKTYKPFRKLLEGVVFNISGIQNPERSNLRSKALEMGAKYRADWDSTCTHLICAFRNTPKYNQVQGLGKIVKKDWVLQCHANRSHLPWRRFALDNKEADKSESEDEICDEAERDKDKEEEEEEKEDAHGPGIVVSEKSTNAANEGDDDDVLMVYDQEPEPPVVICDSGSDTDDEIERVRAKAKVDSNSTAKPENKPENGSSQLHPAEYKTGAKFYLDEDLGAVKIIKCHSIISKFGGEVIESRDESDFWIKSHAPSAEFLNKAKLPVVRPLWLEESADMDCMLPIKRYLH